MRHYPLLAASLVLIILTGVLYIIALEHTNGHFTYALDDAYIHLAIGKHLAEEGNFGTNPGEFASASSSIGWTLLLALTIVVFGNVVLLPLYLNIFAAFAVMVILYYIYRRWMPFLTARWQTVLLIAAIVLIPLPILIFIGMEHTLHVALTLLALYVAVETLIHPLSQEHWWLLVVGPAVVAVRYEGLFLMFIVCCLLLLQRHILFAVVTGILSLAPVAVFGFISLYNGEYILPNSIMAKTLAAHTNFTTGLLYNTILAPYLVMALVLLIIYFFLRLGPVEDVLTDRTSLVTILTGSTVGLHFVLANFGWLFRYEAYLVALLFVTGPMLVEHFRVHRDEKRQSEPQNLPGRYRRVLTSYQLWFLVAVLLLIIMRAPLSSQVPTISNVIYSQQYQMARFRQEYYQDDPIALNDIGYVSYLADTPILDLVGLANHEVVALHFNRDFSTEAVSNLVAENDVSVIITYENWLGDRLPDHWIKAGEWHYDQPLISPSGDVVGFFAVDMASAETLQSNLDDFASQLPADVTYRRSELQ